MPQLTSRPRSLSAMVRALAKRGQYGHSRSPRNFHMAEGYCAYYWHSGHAYIEGEGWVPIVPDQATWDRCVRLLRRYHAFVQHMENVAPGWVEVRRIHWADNSIEATEEATRGSRVGECRTRQLVAPHGDIC